MSEKLLKQDNTNSRFLPQPASVQKLTALWRTRDYEGLLAERISPFAYIVIDGLPFWKCALELVCECSRELQAKYPFAMLRLTLVLYSANRVQLADDLLQNIGAEIEAVADEGERRRLLGEWTFVSAMACYPDIEKMLSVMERADELVDERVSVLDSDDCALIHLSSPYAVFHNIAGKADEQGKQFSRFVELYERLTGGGGRGADALYNAGLCYYRGDFKQAELLAYKAAYLAETKHQSSLQMGAARCIAQINMQKMDMAAFSRAVEMLERTAKQHPEHSENMELMLEYERTDLFFEISVTEYAPEWIRNGERENYPLISYPFLKYMQLCYLFLSEKYEPCIGLGEALLKQHEIFGVLVKATIGMYVAVSYIMLGQTEQGMVLFIQSFSPMLKDKLYLVFTFFMNTLTVYWTII